MGTLEHGTPLNPTPFFGGLPPKPITGALYTPPGYTKAGTGVTTTINRCYYIPWVIVRAITFAAAVTENTGTGDNGETYRVMFFNDDAAAGGPGSLAKDFGEVTLTGAAAVRTLASSWAATPGMYWGAVWHSSSAAMVAMAPYTGGANGFVPPHYGNEHAIGNMVVANPANGAVAAHYVDTAYGAAPANAVAPTASLQQPLGVATGVVPSLYLKV